MSVQQTNELLRWVAERAIDYRETLPHRNVAPTAEAIERLKEFDVSLQDEPVDAGEVIKVLEEIGSPATVATTGGRYFGFVTGGQLPASQAASWLVDAWDQCAAMRVSTPVAVALEEIAIGWMLELLNLPQNCGASFVTGATMANFTALAAARHSILEKAGWNVEENGLFGAPEISVIIGEEAHASIYKALGFLGLGRKRVITVPADSQGRIRLDALPELTNRTIICLHAGNVNTGAFDPAVEICRAARRAGAWVHVDGAFGLWAAASPKLAHLSAGYEEADSWAVDAHKWLNVTYDSGIAFVREPEYLRRAMSVTAAYLSHDHAAREPIEYTPENSRRARGVPVWATLRSLGKRGVADLIETTCRHAARFAEGLQAAGFQILNEVVINQVLVSFGDARTTREIIAAVQTDGTCWCGGTVWQGQTAMRISVSSWATTEADVERSLSAIVRLASKIVEQKIKTGKQNIAF